MIKSMTCEHGQLARQCDYCEKDREIAELRQQFEACQEAGLKLAKQVGLARKWLEADTAHYTYKGLMPGDGTIDRAHNAREAFRQSVSGEGSAP